MCGTDGGVHEQMDILSTSQQSRVGEEKPDDSAPQWRGL